MKKETPQKKARKKYVKPELTKHKKVGTDQLEMQEAAECSECGMTQV